MYTQEKRILCHHPEVVKLLHSTAHCVCTHTAQIDRQTMAANIKIHIYVYCFGMAIWTGGRGDGNSDDGGDGDNNRHTHSHMVWYVRRFFGRTNTNFRCPSLILSCRFWSFANPVCAWQVYWVMIKCVRMCEMGDVRIYNGAKCSWSK